MFPAVYLLPLMLLSGLSSESTATQSDNSTGKKYFIVLPENIASYHPIPPKNQIYVTALYNDTSVTIIQHTYNTRTVTMQAAESRDFILDGRLELGKAAISNNVLEITSTKEITIQAISFRNSSIQTALVIPTDKLAKKYLIPPIPQIQGSTLLADVVTTLVTERAPFKLIIVNGDKANKITVKGNVLKEVNLQPKQVAQIWVREKEALRVVEATQPVAVLFGHPCAIQSKCNCGLLYTMLSPARDETLKFFIPSTFPWEDETKILLSETGSAKIEAFSPDSPLIKVAGTAILYHPKLLLTLIPETDFACCYVVTPIPDMQNYAVIVVHKDQTEGVHVGKNPHQGSEWTELKGTDYVSTKITVQPRATPDSSISTTIIWHASSKMAVYFLGQDSNSIFGNPAPVISKSPDYRGCVLIPGVIKIGDNADGWRESLKYCRDKDMELICLSEAKSQPQATKRLSELNNGNLQEVWIGMRQSSLTGEYYWVNEDPVKSTNWQNGEPSIETSHKCVLMGAKSDKDFSWRSEDCCKAFHPVCYTETEILESWDD
ncbi:uncharacterized protein LOC118471104 isoform X2 [Amphiprion ocellaris]|uniref:uncharacterized protein LOC118471104 isoform X2 n=1 Tax=Amphiprion ocellaris TaxID=80972 RepID=UPI0024113750|nr:uncharacterized protein LOC118471104 isoform X2 [Amphiprion ocellaris]